MYFSTFHFSSKTFSPLVNSFVVVVDVDVEDVMSTTNADCPGSDEILHVMYVTFPFTFPNEIGERSVGGWIELDWFGSMSEWFSLV